MFPLRFREKLVVIDSHTGWEEVWNDLRANALYSLELIPMGNGSLFHFSLSKFRISYKNRFFYTNQLSLSVYFSDSRSVLASVSIGTKGSTLESYSITICVSFYDSVCRCDVGCD